MKNIRCADRIAFRFQPTAPVQRQHIGPTGKPHICKETFLSRPTHARVSLTLGPDFRDQFWSPKFSASNFNLNG